MKDVSFYDIVISKKDQRIVSADAWIYDAFGPYATKPMNEMIAIEDMEIYQNNIKNCDGKWYPSKIICPDTMYYTYMKAAEENENDRQGLIAGEQRKADHHQAGGKTDNGELRPTFEDIKLDTGIARDGLPALLDSGVVRFHGKSS